MENNRIFPAYKTSQPVFQILLKRSLRRI